MITDPHQPQPGTTARAGRTSSPWDHWSWLLGVVWVVFLGIPLAALVVADNALGWRALGIAGLVLFALVYAWGMYRVDHQRDRTHVPRVGRQHLAVMLLLLGLEAPIIGLDVIGMLPFAVILAVLSLPLRHGVLVWVACLLVAVLVPVLTDQVGALILAGVLVPAGAFVLLMRQIQDRDTWYRALADEQRITQERDRVARDVHDVLGHSLTVVTVKLELAERLIDLDPERAKAELDAARSMTRQSLAEIRATIAGLRVTRLAEEVEHSRSALTDAGITAALPDDPEVVDPRHRLVLAWAVREIVTNVVRHSGATQCSVEWGADWLTVTDNGIGMRGHREGNGIRGLRERVRGAGGALDIAGGTGEVGTCVRVTL